MRLVAQYNVQAELAPHEEESRRQECLNFACSGQLIIFFWVPKTEKRRAVNFFYQSRDGSLSVAGSTSGQLIFFMFVDVNGKKQGS